MANPLPQAEERLRELAERYGIPGVACGLDVGGERVEIHHGVTHVDHPLPVDGGTLFQIASNSKIFTAALVMQLVEQGRLELDDPIRKHLPDFRMPESRFDDEITLRMLLSHRVGWDGDALFVRQPDPPTLDQALAPMARARQLVPPDTHFTYSNAGFSVLGRLVEVLTGDDFETALTERILRPLGMSRTFARADSAIFHRVAMRHLTRANGVPIALPGGGWQAGWELEPIDLPAGGLISCVDDLLRWLRFWLGRTDDDAVSPTRAETRRRR
ncbi:MAG: serine hydrolase domain-containing protein, partial [Myxococcota bacterium]|nr:serine hydrolase domain-containing protein [Myxococcota bacterium]